MIRCGHDCPRFRSDERNTSNQTFERYPMNPVIANCGAVRWRGRDSRRRRHSPGSIDNRPFGEDAHLSESTGDGGESQRLEDDLTRPVVLRELLARHGMQPSRRFGQNFLINRPALERIVRAAQLEREDQVLEIGPGAGVLTRELSARCRRVVAIELDRGMIPVLEDSLARHPNVEVHQGDALRLDWAGMLGRASGVKVVANIPYNITSPLLVRILEYVPAFASATLLVQREVAQRVVAEPGGAAYGSLSVFVAYYAAARIVATVPAGAFLPPPKVESAVVHLVPHSEPPVEEPPERLFRVTRAAFGQRRKTLRNALSAGLDLPADAVADALSAAAVDPGLRAEALGVAEFDRISRVFHDRFEGTARLD